MRADKFSPSQQTDSYSGFQLVPTLNVGAENRSWKDAKHLTSFRKTETRPKKQAIVLTRRRMEAMGQGPTNSSTTKVKQSSYQIYALGCLPNVDVSLVRFFPPLNV